MDFISSRIPSARPERGEGQPRPPRDAAGGCVQVLSSTLGWTWAALVEADEDASLNEQRLYAGEALAPLHEQDQARPHGKG